MHFSKLIMLILLGLLVSCNKFDFDKPASDLSSDSTACVGPHSGPVVDQSDFENRINLMYTNSPGRGCISFANYNFTPQVSDYTALSEIDKRELYLMLIASSLDDYLSNIGASSWEDALLIGNYTNTNDLLYYILIDCDCGYGIYSPIVLAGKNIGQLNWSNVDLAGANISSLTLVNLDLSFVRGLSVSQLNSKPIWGAILPKMDLTGFDATGRWLQGVDFRKTTGLTAEMLAEADGAEFASNLTQAIINLGADYPYIWALANIKYPAMDIGSLDLTNRNLQYSDFSLVTGLTTEQLNTAINNISGGLELSGVIFPSMTISGLNPTAVLSGADMSRVLGLTQAEYNSYSQKFGLVLPTVRDW